MKTLLVGALGMLVLQVLLVGSYLAVDSQDPIILWFGLCNFESDTIFWCNAAPALASCPYAPECVEGEFCEVELLISRFLGSSLGKGRKIVHLGDAPGINAC